MLYYFLRSNHLQMTSTLCGHQITFKNNIKFFGRCFVTMFHIQWNLYWIKRISASVIPLYMPRLLYFPSFCCASNLYFFSIKRVLSSWWQAGAIRWHRFHCLIAKSSEKMQSFFLYTKKMLHEAVLKRIHFDIDPGNHALRTESTDKSLGC